MGPAISINNLSLAIGGNQILAPLSADLEAGQLHLLIGPNGAGKTSLLKSMLGLTPYKGCGLKSFGRPKNQNPERFICRQPLDYRSPTKRADPPPPNNTKTTRYRLSIG